MHTMTFTEMQYRWLFAVALPFVLIACGWVWYKSRSARDRFMPTRQRIFDEPARLLSICALACCDFVLISCIIAGLMHPERRIIVREPVREHTATVIAVDISSSMKAEAGYFGDGGRVGAVKKALRELMMASESSSDLTGGMFGEVMAFLKGSAVSQRRLMEGQRIGIVTFGGRAMNEMPLTARHGTILSVLKFPPYLSSNAFI